VGVVVIDVDLKYVFEVAATTDQGPVQTLTPDGADETLGVRVGSRREYRCADHPKAFAAEHLVEGAAEFRVAIAHQEPTSPELLAHRHEQIAGLLGDPGAGWPDRATSKLHPARVELDEEQHIEAPRPDGLDGEEIGGEEPSGLGAQKLSPCQLAGPRCRSEPVAAQHGPDRRR